MSTTDILIHAANFVAPAFWIGCMVVMVARWTAGGRAVHAAWSVQWLVVFLVGVAVLLAGLWLTGRDARMFTYAVLVLACGTTQWLLSRRAGS